MPCGDHLGAVFELADFLDAYGGRRLLDVALRIAPDVVLDERAQPGTPGWRVTDRVLRQTAGLCREGQVDEAVAAILGACDGTRPLGAVLAEAAGAADADAADLARAAMPVVHQLGRARVPVCPRSSEAQSFLFVFTSNPAWIGAPTFPDADCGT